MGKREPFNFIRKAVKSSLEGDLVPIWRLASDMIPVMGVVFTLLHVIVLVPTISLFLISDNGSYECDAKTLVRVAMYSTMICNLVSVLHDVLMIPVGLRGGPLEERKRWLMKHLLHSRLVFIVLSLGFVIYATFVVYGPDVQKNCWALDPCSRFPNSCSGSVLSPACRTLYEARVNDVKECQSLWFDYAATYFITYYNTTATKASKNICNKTISADSPEFKKWENDAGRKFPDPVNGIIRSSEFRYDVAKEWLNYLGIPLRDIPWMPCFSDTCYDILVATTECEDYNALINFGLEESNIAEAQAVIISTWIIIALVSIVLLLAFNAFPEYAEEDSWTRFVKWVSRMCCCQNLLVNAETEYGESAASGLGKLFHLMFGGIDLDPTDQILGMYLVSERQAWRRKRHAIEALAMNDYRYRKSLGCFPRYCFPKKHHVEGLTATLENDSDSRDIASHNLVTLVPNCQRISTHSTMNTSADDSFIAPRVYHSFLRLDTDQSWLSGICDGRNSNSAAAEETSENVQMNSRTVLLAHAEKVFLTPCKIAYGHFEPSLDGVKAARFYTIQPEGLVSTTELKKIQEISWFAKAAYGLQTSKWNGAKTGKWYTDSLDWILSCFKTCAPRKVLRSHFQKRNMNAIVEYTKVDPSDILYVSYTSTPLGIIPYMILLDRKSKNVVISIRGTVGFSDLITDLLGKSEDATRNLPAWVLDEVSKSMTDEENQQDVDLYVHTGIMSSAKAVLKDLESHNLIEAVETVLQSNAYSESETAQNGPDLNNLDDDDEIVLSLDRAQSMIHDKLNTKGWRLLVTGHSLGAAVASLVSFHLYEKFPTLSCIAFNPPGGVMDPHLSALSQKFCTSLVVGYDAISRISIRNIKGVIDEMVLALGRCKRPKLFILMDIILGRRRDPTSCPPTFCTFEDIDEEARAALQKYVSTSQLYSLGMDNHRMFPPGKLAFLRPFPPFGDDQKIIQYSWDAVWIRKEDLMEEGLILSRDMTSHHRLPVVQEALKIAIESRSEQAE